MNEIGTARIQPGHCPGDTSREEILAEYVALREEILTRIRMRDQVMALTAIVLGTVITVATQTELPHWVLLVYPIISTSFAIAWGQSDYRIGQIGEYIHDHIEMRLPGLQWEHTIRHRLKQQPFKRVFRVAEASAVVFFLGTQMLTVLLALLQFRWAAEEVILLVIDVGAMIATLLILQRRRRDYARRTRVADTA